MINRRQSKRSNTTDPENGRSLHPRGVIYTRVYYARSITVGKQKRTFGESVGFPLSSGIGFILAPENLTSSTGEGCGFGVTAPVLLSDIRELVGIDPGTGGPGALRSADVEFAGGWEDTVWGPVVLVVLERRQRDR